MEKHFVIGTAGHVDHGKTMLVKALTGKDTDRLKEEKERGISIELGFASFKLPSGISAGIVDVPGHERFIKNMLAGVSGMDLVLLVIAADEGVMPQTSEHLDIIKLLQVPRGILVITKIDMVEADWVDMVEEEIREAVKGTIFEEAPSVRVSSVTKEGIDKTIDLIDKVAADLQTRQVTGWPRMAIDRVFTVTGFGTVVTGTLIEGSLRVGDSVELMPKGIETRVRNLQVHGSKVEVASAGQRVAINLAGVELDQVDRGDVLTWPGVLAPSHRIDVKFHLLNSASRPLINRARVRIHIGTSEILGRMVLLDREELEPGQTTYAQIECEQPMVAAKGDRFVIRSYSPMHTIGGGTVIDPAPAKHRRFKQEVLDTLATKEKGTPEELMLQALEVPGQELVPLGVLAAAIGSAEKDLKEQMDALVETEKVLPIKVEAKAFFIGQNKFAQWGRELTAMLDEYHRKFPLRLGMPKEEIRSRAFSGLNNKLFNALLQAFNEQQLVQIVGDSIAKYGFKPVLTKDQELKFSAVLENYQNSGFQTPAWDELVEQTKLAQPEEALNYFVDAGYLVKLEDNVLLHKDNFDQGTEKVIAFIKDKGEITLAEARDLLNSSRKYVLPFLNRLDKDKITRRVEDKRILYK